MEEIVKTSIKGRYDAFFNAYEIKDLKMKGEIDDLFKRINDLGEKTHSIEEFENLFSQSNLNKEYIDLFTKIASTCKPIVYENDDVTSENKHEVLNEIASDAKYVVDDITMPARRKAREEFDKKMRDTPLGKIEQINNMKNVFQRFFKKK